MQFDIIVLFSSRLHEKLKLEFHELFYIMSAESKCLNETFYVRANGD